MCGIFGTFANPSDAQHDVDVDRALAALRHRGPDGRGVYRSPGVVFGHARLAVLDLSAAGAQPMASEDGNVVVVFNGEIYNHHELRRELEAKGHRFRSRSDTEAIVEGYRAWGEAIFERIDGMFAIGLYDRTAGRLLLARDRAGKKPLFYAHSRGRLWFASEPKALFAAGMRAEVDPSSLPFLLAYGYTPSPRTFYRGVAQLPPASVLAIDVGGEPRVRRIWRAPFAAPPLRITEREAASEVRRLVERAVAKRLEADVPLGAFLSGGVDSTIVVGVMARLASTPVKTFSIGFAGDPRFDETRYARSVAKLFGTEHTEFELGPSSFELVERLVEAHDGPFADSSAIPTSVVSMLTRKHVTVALSGDGGDELFCGYRRLLAVETAERVPKLIRSLASRALRGRIPMPGSFDRATRARRFARVASLPLPERAAAWISLLLYDLDRILRPGVVSADELEAPFAWARAIAAPTEGASALARVLGITFDGYLPEDLLVKADRSSMLHSLEVRSPFLDTELIEFAARLPDDMKRRGSQTKRVLREAFSDLIPPEIAKRPKMGFGIPLGAWFSGSLKGYLRDRFAPGARMYEYLEPAFVSGVMEAHFERRADYGHTLWTLLSLEVWLDQLASRNHVASTHAAPEVTTSA